MRLCLQFTPQYGDSFIELIRLERLDNGCTQACQPETRNERRKKQKGEMKRREKSYAHSDRYTGKGRLWF